MTMPVEIADHLRALPRVTSVRPCHVIIKNSIYSACHYTERCTVDPSTRAYREGQREYVREMIYAVGMLPAVKRNGNVAFRVNGDTRDWYVAGYYGNVAKRRQEVKSPNEFHPFGNSFLLAPWDVADSTIDQHERRPYKRVSIHVVWRDRQGVSTTAYHSIRQAWQGGRAILSGLA